MIVSLAQMFPVWLDRKATADKICTYISQAAAEGANLVCFGETLLSGYPFWIDPTDGARFESEIQKDFYAHYVNEAVVVEKDLVDIQSLAKQHNIAVYLGVIERAVDRGGQSVYCSLVYIDQQGEIQSVHRKLMPTYEERLVWAMGDGNGLQVHELEEFHVGGLNCWENWMPLARTTLTGMGETLHVATWPGCLRNTIGLTRHMAKESRSYVISISGLMTTETIGDQVPHADLLRKNMNEWVADGGSCIANPDGSWLIEPVTHKECLLTAELDLDNVRRERHNFDPVGHYSRPDVFQLKVNRDRQNILGNES